MTSGLNIPLLGYSPDDPPSLSEILRCTHCGLCLNQCPTYRVLGWEMDSPRGRIYLMRGVAEGRFEINPMFAEHMDVCLACRACQTACPASIDFGKMVEAARWQVNQSLPQSRAEKFIRWLVFAQLFPHNGRLRLLATLTKIYQRSGLQWLARRLHLIPRPMRDSERLLPRLPDHFTPLGKTYTAVGEKRGRVALLAGCVMGTVYAPVNDATIRVLTRNGFEVVVPAGQICCGALAVHAGERAMAKEMARKNIEAFTPIPRPLHTLRKSPLWGYIPPMRKSPLRGYIPQGRQGKPFGEATNPCVSPLQGILPAHALHPAGQAGQAGEGEQEPSPVASSPAERGRSGGGSDGGGQGGGSFDAILVNAAGCGVAMKEYGDLLKSDEPWKERAEKFSSKVRDVSEFLAAQGIEPPTRAINRRVTYQDPCHLAHGQSVRSQPRQLLKAIPGLQLVEMRDPDRCCGSAGIYNITHPDIAMQILDQKMENVAATEPDIIVTANAGCMLQLQLGVQRAGLKAEVLHVMELLDRAYGSTQGDKGDEGD